MTPPRVILALLCGASRVNVVAPEIPRRGHEQQRNVWLERRGVRHWRVGSRDQRCRQRAGGSGSWRLGDRGNNRPSHQVRQGGGHRRARRYLIPELPQANYSVWVRGYGLVDSKKIRSAPGKALNLQAVAAPSAKAAAEYYPGMYWYSLLRIPDKSEFPGTGDKGNGISENIKTQDQWIDTIKNACQSCHALGSKGIRTVPKVFQESGDSFQA